MEVIIILFEVRRTSCWTDECPYEKCIPIKLTRVETRTLKTPEEFDAKFSKVEGKWLEVGSNHRVDKQGFITRDREEALQKLLKNWQELKLKKKNIKLNIAGNGIYTLKDFDYT